MRAPPRWRLAPLLALAARGEASARAALGDALGARARLAVERERDGEALRAQRARIAALARGPEAGVDAQALRGRALHAGRVAGEEARLVAVLRGRDGALAAADAELERRRGALARARAEVRALEAGRDAWRAARARDRDRADEDAVDERVSARPGAGA